MPSRSRKSQQSRELSQNSETIQLSASFIQPTESVNHSMQPDQLKLAQRQANLAVEGSFSFENKKKQSVGDVDNTLNQSELKTSVSKEV